MARERAAKADLQIVGMRAEGEDVDRFTRNSARTFPS
jgi:hypothetical protein